MSRREITVSVVKNARGKCASLSRILFQLAYCSHADAVAELNIPGHVISCVTRGSHLVFFSQAHVSAARLFMHGAHLYSSSIARSCRPFNTRAFYNQL